MSTDEQGGTSDLPSRLRVAELAVVVATALAAVGIGIADFSPHYGLWYWFAMVPIFGGVSLTAVWARAQREGTSAASVIRTQLFHWSGLLLAVYVVFLLQQTGRMNNADAGLVALLILALTTFLAGVHGDWRLAVLGAILGLGAVAAAFLEEYLWVCIIPLLVGIVILIHRARRAPPSRASSA